MLKHKHPYAEIKGKKVKFALEEAMKAERVVMYTSTLSSTSALDVGGLSTPRHAPAALTLAKMPGTRGTGGWLGPTAGLEGSESPVLTGIRSPDLPVRSESLYRLRHPSAVEVIVSHK